MDHKNVVRKLKTLYSEYLSVKKNKNMNYPSITEKRNSFIDKIYEVFDIGSKKEKKRAIVKKLVQHYKNLAIPIESCNSSQGKFSRRKVISKYTEVSQNSGEDDFSDSTSKNLLLDDEYFPPIKKTKKL